MKLFYRGVAGKLETVYRQCGPAKFCCEPMRDRWGSLVGFGVKGNAATTSREVSLYGSLPQADGLAVAILTPIDFCPWCGDAIEACREK